MIAWNVTFRRTRSTPSYRAETVAEDYSSSTKETSGAERALGDLLDALDAVDEGARAWERTGSTAGVLRPVEALELARTMGRRHAWADEVLGEAEIREIRRLEAGIQWARGMCSDELPHHEIDAFLAGLRGGDAA